MEDNDIRGFLDGRFKNGWNQPGQMHVRVGRRKQVSPKYGEQELCRVLQRWDRIELPPLSNILHTLLSLEVENGPPFELQIFLYEVKKDWNPGGGRYPLR